MNYNYISPFYNYSTFSAKTNKYASKTSKNKLLISNMPSDIQSNSYQQICYESVKNINNKNVRGNKLFKRSALFPSMNGQESRRESYQMPINKAIRYSESNLKQNDLNTSGYRPNFRILNKFNGKYEKCGTKKNFEEYEHLNGTDKNKSNCSFYESKYINKNTFDGSKTTKRLKNIIYSNENFNTINISSNKQNRKYASNFSLKNQINNNTSYSKVNNKQKNEENKSLINPTSEIANKKEKNYEKTKIETNNNTKSINNNHYFKQSVSNNLDIPKDFNYSSFKKIKIDKNSENQDNNKSTNNKNIISKSTDKIANNKIENSNSKDDKKLYSNNKKIEIIKSLQTNIKETKKNLNKELKTISLCSKERNSNNAFNIMSIQKFNLNKTNSKEINNYKERNNYSYALSKTNENSSYKISNTEKRDKYIKSFVKELNLINYKKSTTSEIDKTLNNNKNSNSNISHIKSKILSKKNNYNNNTAIKKDQQNKSQYFHTISNNTNIKKNPSFSDNKNNSSLNNTKNNNNLTNIIESSNQKQKTRRNLSHFPKYQSRVNLQISINNGNSEDNWEDNEYMGLKKKTYDQSIKGKKMFKNELTNLLKNSFSPSNLFSQPTIIKSCESISVPGKKENGNKKINQDSYIIEKNINGILNFNIFGVFDGHGEDGHHASQFVAKYIINNLRNHPLIKKCEDTKEIYQKLILNGYEIIEKLFTNADIQIQKEKFDYKNSGTTCVIVIQLEEKIICANAGDSRAIMIFDESQNDNLINTKICPLSYDCKPDLPNEKKRIYEFGGTVERLLDENNEEAGPFRVWAFGEDFPGLAMSRSIGDIDAKKLGVIPNPQIVEYNIDNSTKYLLICSDGVWEFISNEDAMEIGNKFYLRNDAVGLCQELYKKSYEFWLKEDIVVDDITAIAVFF